MSNEDTGAERKTLPASKPVEEESPEAGEPTLVSKGVEPSDEEGVETPAAEEPAEGGSRLPDKRLILAGCGGLGGLAILALIVAGLIFGLGGKYQALNEKNPTISYETGISVSRRGEGNLRIRIESVAQQAFLAGEDRAFSTARERLPSYLELQSPIYVIKQRGEGEAEIAIALPAGVSSYSTLDLYTWDEEAGEWVFVPGHVDPAEGVIRTTELPDNVAIFQTSPLAPLVSTTLESGQTFDPEMASNLNLVFASGLTAQPDGSLTGSLVGGWQMNSGYAVIPLLRATDSAALSSLLNNPASVALHIEDIRSLVVGDGYNGVAIDYGDIDPADREAFTRFISDLAGALDEYERLLVVVLPAPDGGPETWDTGGYDWRAIGRLADIVVISGSDDPTFYALNGGITNLLGWAVGEISRYKLHVAFSTRSVEETDGGLRLISYDEAIAPLGVVTLEGEASEAYEPGTSLTFTLNGNVTDVTPDLDTGAYVYTVDGEGGQRRIWIITANTLRARMDMAAAFNVGGMVLNDMMADGNDNGLLTAIAEFKARSVSSVPAQLVLQWTVTGSSGALLHQTTGLGTPFVWQADEPGDYTVEADLVGARVSDLGAVGVAIGEPEPEETETATPPPIVISNSDSPPPADTPAPTQAATPPPSAGGAGPDGGGFELGGQVPNAIAHADYMRQAGMTWVKFQVVWPYADAATAGAFVGAGHAAGFKVLLSVKGPLYPQSIDYAAFTSFIGQVASYQPDAIEVWNEMNLNREWPSGQIDPTVYVNNMLAPAFNAIKQASPGTMVIIGALAPTGVDDGVNVWADDRYVRGLAAAGAANYANCIGVHHNAGATSPSATSGHPTGSGHYSWYFLPTIDVYYGGMGGALPVCLTEYGYVSPEGYGPLPSNFSWGSGITVANQAAWLAEGAQIARGLGYVRLMIIWNVDYTYWADDDPQAGYAIVRPDGSCPACASLGAVMP